MVAARACEPGVVFVAQACVIGPAVNAFVDPLIEALRPRQLKGKGFVFDFLTPRSGTRRVRVWGQYEMRLDLANVVQRQIYMGCFGRYMTVCTRALLPAAGVFLDVGAHIGYFTLLASHCLGPRGKVYALEPNPAAFTVLQNHLQGNNIGNVQATSIALCETDGTLRLYIPPAGEHREYNVTIMTRPDWTITDVPCARLDKVLSGWKIDHIDLMKMDVEGAEPRVLKGGAECLRAGVIKHLIVEVNGPRLTEGGSSPARLVAQLAKLGFLPAKLSGRRAIPVSADTWDLDPAHEYDRLFRHRSVR